MLTYRNPSNDAFIFFAEHTHGYQMIGEFVSWKPLVHFYKRFIKFQTKKNQMILK